MACRFCQITSSKDDYILFENTKFIAILDNKPLSKGHFLVIPTAHYRNISDIPKEEFVELFTIVNEFSSKVQKILKADGLNIAINSGMAAGQQVDHLHVHIIPRYSEDQTIIGAINKEQEKDVAELSIVYKLLTSNLE